MKIQVKISWVGQSTTGKHKRNNMVYVGGKSLNLFFYFWRFAFRYLPQRPDNYSSTCRYTGWSILDGMHVQNSLPSLEETPKFLRAMRNVSATQCDCLPDCESTNFQYSVSTNNFMWGDFFLSTHCLSEIFQGMWLSQPQHQPTLHFGERTAPKTLAWGGGQLGNRWAERLLLLQLINSDINLRTLQSSTP